MTADTESRLSLPVQAPRTPADTSPLVARLAEVCGASWVDADSIDAWAAQGGDRVVLLAGDAVRFPEGQDVAVVLPELRRSLGARFAVGIVQRAHEDALARRFGSQRWPTLLFLRDGQYVTALPGMHDWEDFLHKTEAALAAPVSRPPSIGIPLVSAASSDGGCH